MMIFILYLFIALCALSVQATLFKGISPDFVLILVCFYSVKYGQIKGMTYGALTGLMIDSTSGFILGPNIFSKSLAGFFIGMIRQKIFFWNVVVNTLLIASFALIDIFLVQTCLETFLDISFDRSLRIYILQIIYTTASGLLIYPLLKPEENGMQWRSRI